ncbi:MAG: glycosyl transferase family protein [Pseudomonadota bacterium]
MSLAPYIRTLGRGPSRARSLTQDEARAAMEIILSGEAPGEAVGGLLMLLRYRGESAAEIAGLTEAVLAEMDDWSSVPATLDWPTYAAGRSRGRPLFLLSAKLLAAAGQRVLLHGWNSHQSAIASVRDALPSLGIGVVETPDAARREMATSGLVYLPLEALSRPAYDLIRLRDVLGLRSCINTVLRMVNPAGAPAMVQGVFHPTYRNLQSDAAQLLGQASLLVLKGGGGEFERHPGKSIQAYGLIGGEEQTFSPPILMEETRRLHEPDMPSPPLADLWSGAARDPFAEATVIGTAALALIAAGQCKTMAEADKTAAALWASRSHKTAA